MPKCKNDSTRSYKGTEPSPKGLGYCAHAEKVGKKMKGKDGNMWIVKEVAGGSRRWTKISGTSESKTTQLPEMSDKQMNHYKTFQKLLKKKRLIVHGEQKAFDRATVVLDETSYDWKKALADRVISTPPMIKRSFQMGNKLLVGDPGFIYPTRHGTYGPYVFPAKPGKWSGYYHMWYGHVPNVMVASHSMYKFPDSRVRYARQNGEIGVDTGMVVVMDFQKHPRTQDRDEHEEWYMEIVDRILGPRQVLKSGKLSKKSKKSDGAVAIDGGYVCNSGYGDGMYPFTIGKVGGKVVQVIVTFAP